MRPIRVMPAATRRPVRWLHGVHGWMAGQARHDERVN